MRGVLARACVFRTRGGGEGGEGGRSPPCMAAGICSRPPRAAPALLEVASRRAGAQEVGPSEARVHPPVRNLLAAHQTAAPAAPPTSPARTRAARTTTAATATTGLITRRRSRAIGGGRLRAPCRCGDSSAAMGAHPLHHPVPSLRTGPGGTGLALRGQAPGPFFADVVRLLLVRLPPPPQTHHLSEPQLLPGAPTPCPNPLSPQELIRACECLIMSWGCLIAHRSWEM